MAIPRTLSRLLCGALIVSSFAAAAQSTHAGLKINGRPVPTTATRNYTWHMNLDVPSNFTKVRVRLFNASTTPLYSVKAVIAVSTTAADKQVMPSGGNASWKAVTVNGASTLYIPAATYSSGNQIVPGYVDSDVLTLASLPKSSGAEGAFVMFRESTADATQTIAQDSAAVPASMASVGLYETGRIASDGANSPPNPYFADNGAQNSGPAASFQFYTSTPVVTLLGGGDSLMMGTGDGNTPWQGGYMPRLADYIHDKKGLKVYVSNYGHQSLTTEYYLQNVITALKENTARMALYAVWSPNDTDKFTEAGNDARKARVQSFIANCQAVGTRPVLVTPFPVSYASAEQEAVRREMSQYAKSLGVAVIDFDAAFTNYASTTGGWKVPSYTSDQTHLTASGYDYAGIVAWMAVSPYF